MTQNGACFCNKLSPHSLPVEVAKVLINSTEGARDFGDHYNFDSELSGNGKSVQPHVSHLNHNPSTNKQQMNPNSRNSHLIYFCFKTVNIKLAIVQCALLQQCAKWQVSKIVRPDPPFS